LEWLEQGRCLVWTQLNQLRTPVDNLAEHDPDLAQHFLNVGKRLECAAARGNSLQSGMSLLDKITLEKEAHTHLNLAKEWNDLLHTIRTTISGFHNFLKPSTFPSLIQNLPDSGPIVVVNVHNSCCDAIAVMAGVDKPLHIQLPEFSSAKARTYQQHMEDLKEHHLGMRAAELDPLDNQQERAMKPHQKVQEVCNVLHGLWKNVVKPILEALAFLVSRLYFETTFYPNEFNRPLNHHPKQSYPESGGAQQAL
jgi:hypothetical protein